MTELTSVTGYRVITVCFKSLASQRVAEIVGIMILCYLMCGFDLNALGFVFVNRIGP